MQSVRYSTRNLSKSFLSSFKQHHKRLYLLPSNQSTRNHSNLKLLNTNTTIFSFSSLKNLFDHPFCLPQLKEAQKMYSERNYVHAQELYFRVLQIYRQPSEECAKLYAYTLRKIVQCAVRTNHTKKVINKLANTVANQSYDKIDGNTKIFLAVSSAILENNNSEQVNPQLLAFKPGSADQKDQYKMFLIFQKISGYKSGLFNSLKHIKTQYMSKDLDFDQTILEIKHLFNLQCKIGGINLKSQTFGIEILSIRYLSILQKISLRWCQNSVSQDANKLLKQYQVNEPHLKYRGINLLLILLMQKGKYLQAQGLIGFCQGQLYDKKMNASSQPQEYYFSRMLKGVICSDKPARRKEAENLLQQSLNNLDVDKLFAEIMILSEESMYQF